MALHYKNIWRIESVGRMNRGSAASAGGESALERVGRGDSRPRSLEKAVLSRDAAGSAEEVGKDTKTHYTSLFQN